MIFITWNLLGFPFGLNHTFFKFSICIWRVCAFCSLEQAYICSSWLIVLFKSWMALFSYSVSKSVSTQCDNFCRSWVFYTTIVDLLISILNLYCKVLLLNLHGSLYLSSIKYPLPFKVLFALNFVLSDVNIGTSVLLLMSLEYSFQFFYFQTFCVNFFTYVL